MFGGQWWTSGVFLTHCPLVVDRVSHWTWLCFPQRPRLCRLGTGSDYHARCPLLSSAARHLSPHTWQQALDLGNHLPNHKHCILEQGPPWTRNSMTCLNWLASKPQRAACLCLPQFCDYTTLSCLTFWEGGGVLFWCFLFVWGFFVFFFLFCFSV